MKLHTESYKVQIAVIKLQETLPGRKITAALPHPGKWADPGTTLQEL